MKYASVFGGAMNDTTTKEYIETVEIGRILSENGYIIKNGGYRGMMEASSKGAYESGGKSIGYTCKSFPTTKGNEYLTETVVCEDIYDRLRLLIQDSDLYIIQKGGIGTLSELFLTLDLVRKKKDPKKIILIGEYWKDIIVSISPLLSEKETQLVTIVNDYSEIKKHI